MMDERKGLPSSSFIECLSLCPGALRMSRGAQKPATSETLAWAASGDRVHMYCEAPELIDLSAYPAELDVAQRCLKERDELIEQIFGGTGKGNQYFEHRFWLFYWNNHTKPRFSGRVDFAHVQSPTGLVVDYKSLYGEHEESSGNLQLRSQCVLLWLHHKHLEEIYAKIIQPLRGSASKPPVKYTRRDLAQSLEQLEEILDRAEDPKAPLIPGDKQCRFCPARLVCPAGREVLKEVATRDLASLPVIEAQELSRLLEHCQVASGVIEAIQEHARALLQKDPAAIPGWELKENPPIRVINDPQVVYGNLFTGGHIDLAGFMRCVDVGIGKLEREVYTIAKAKDKKFTLAKAKKLVNDHIAGFVTLNFKKPSLHKCTS
jgi:hypothetical protein